ncbi:MAG TPA: hypothetical protein VFT62_00745 [Mycobacteriales bacterium]|nr:hypothetical protein [Mycobacteriales bacterium]
MRRSVGWRRAALLCGGLAVPLGWLLSAPAQAQPLATDRTVTVTVADTVEAWYAASPIDLCTTPLGCTPPVSPYPADTLHVGVAGGQETARTYVLPDLSALAGATGATGTMTLPVATGGQDGTSSPETAKIEACLTTKPVTDGTDGSTAPPPAVDCTTKVPARYDAKHSAFTVDLTPFLASWSAGAPPFGIALLPDLSSAGPTDAWHVTFNDRKRAQTAHISSRLTYSPVTQQPAGHVGAGPSAPAAPSAPAPAPAPPAVPTVPMPPVATNTDVAPSAAPPVVAATQPPTAVAQRPVALSSGFQYPLAFLMPLALLAGALFFTRLFTRDATPRFAARGRVR